MPTTRAAAARAAAAEEAARPDILGLVLSHTALRQREVCAALCASSKTAATVRHATAGRLRLRASPRNLAAARSLARWLRSGNGSLLRSLEVAHTMLNDAGSNDKAAAGQLITQALKAATAAGSLAQLTEFTCAKLTRLPSLLKPGRLCLPASLTHLDVAWSGAWHSPHLQGVSLLTGLRSLRLSDLKRMRSGTCFTPPCVSSLTQLTDLEVEGAAWSASKLLQLPVSLRRLVLSTWRLDEPLSFSHLTALTELDLTTRTGGPYLQPAELPPTLAVLAVEDEMLEDDDEDEGGGWTYSPATFASLPSLKRLCWPYPLERVLELAAGATQLTSLVLLHECSEDKAADFNEVGTRMGPFGEAVAALEAAGAAGLVREVQLLPRRRPARYGWDDQPELPAMVAQLARLPNLASLMMHRVSISAAFVAELGRLSGLTALLMAGAECDTAAMQCLPAALSQLPRLARLGAPWQPCDGADILRGLVALPALELLLLTRVDPDPGALACVRDELAAAPHLTVRTPVYNGADAEDCTTDLGDDEDDEDGF